MDVEVCRAVVLSLEKLGWRPDRSQAGAIYLVMKRQWDMCIEIGESAVEPLITALNDSHEYIRKCAVEALAQIGDERAVEPLIAALADENDMVRQNAASALEKLGWQPDDSATAATYRIAKRRWDKCIEIGSPAVEPLVDALNDNNQSVRRSVVDALSQIDREHPGDLLIAAFQINLVQDLGNLKIKISELPKQYSFEGKSFGPGSNLAQEQIPIICTNIDQSIKALRTGFDPSNNPIAKPEVARGLKNLINATRKPGFFGLVGKVLTVDGIQVLKSCINELEQISGRIF